MTKIEHCPSESTVKNLKIPTIVGDVSFQLVETESGKSLTECEGTVIWPDLLNVSPCEDGVEFQFRFVDKFKTGKVVG